MEERGLNIIWTKGGTGSPTTKLSIPISWCYHMGLSEDEKGVVVTYNEEVQEITIKKRIN